MIEAELADGTILEFPDGTQDDVIDRVVKQHLGSAPQPQQEEAVNPVGMGERAILGAAETALSMGSGIAADIAGGLTGAVDLVGGLFDSDQNLSESVDSAVQTQNRTRDALTYQPRTREGQQQLTSVAETLAPVGEVLQQASQGAGDAVFDATGNPESAALAATGPEAALMALPVVGNVLRNTKNAVLQSRRADIGRRIEAGETDNDLAKYVLDGSQVQKDPKAAKVISSGFDDGVVSALHGASQSDVRAMLKQTELMSRALSNSRQAINNRPDKVVGEIIQGRVDSVAKANRKAGEELNDVARRLKGQEVDVEPAVQSFLDELSAEDVAFKNGRLDFSNATFEGAGDAQKILNTVVKRMRDTRAPDAWDAHRLKRFLDQQVNFGGKKGEGLKGNAERIVKNLRHNLDEILDTNFEDYNRVNTVFAETRGALDDIQDAAGLKTKLDDASLGRLSRRLLSNVASRERLADAVSLVDDMAKRHGGLSVSEDVVTQVMFYTELERVFGQVARQKSFRGELGQASVDVARRGVREVAADKVLGALTKGADPKESIKAMQELLRSRLRQQRQPRQQPSLPATR